jgi:alpha-N-arabinofuranosidase
VFLHGATPSTHETDPVQTPDFDPALKLASTDGGVSLSVTIHPDWAGTRTRPFVTTELLGKASIPNLPYEQPDGSPIRLDTDYLGRPRNAANPTPGPFEATGGESGPFVLKIW